MARLSKDKPFSLFHAVDGFLEEAIPNTKTASFILSTEKKLDRAAEVSEKEREPTVSAPPVAEGNLLKGVEVFPDAVSSLMESFSCKTCKIQLECLEEQRSHFKCDWHKYNVKRTVAKKRVVTLEMFEEKIAEKTSQLSLGAEESDVSSISGSEDESDPEPFGTHSKASKGSSKFFFTLGGEQKLKCAVYKILVTAGSKEAEDDQTLVGRLRQLTRGGGRGTWVVLLCSGGHFAGVVLDARTGAVLEHKTFHRYVVRAKAGGRQSARDATGRAPKSAGSSLRRYNEAALESEVQQILREWSSHLKAAALILAYAPSANQKTLFGAGDGALSKSDPRVRNVPITIRRPTLKEAKRVANVVAQIEYLEEGGGDDDRLAEEASRKLSSGAAAMVDRPMRAASSLKKKPQGDLGGGGDQLGGGGGAVEGSEGSPEDSGMSDLHLAAKSGDPEGVRQLLESGSDPTVRNGRGQTPYAVAADKETRSVFRRYMATAGEQWDWQVAGVPSALTDEMEASQAAKKAEKDAKKKARDKERKAEKKAREKAEKEIAAKAALEAEAKAAAEAAQQLVRYGLDKAGTRKGSGAGSGGRPPAELIEKAREEERAKQAMAAERRLQGLAGQGAGSALDPASSSLSCDGCGAPLGGKVPFFRLSFRYCSTACVRVHRTELEDGGS